MTFQGHVHNGVVVFHGPQAPPEGAIVEVVVVPQAEAPLSDVLLEFAGTIEGLPKDMARQHDHYLHGRPKQ